jgi:hypothetical protein
VVKLLKMRRANTYTVELTIAPRTAQRGRVHGVHKFRAHNNDDIIWNHTMPPQYRPRGRRTEWRSVGWRGGWRRVTTIHPLFGRAEGAIETDPRTFPIQTPRPQQRRHQMNHRMPPQYRARGWRTEWRGRRVGRGVFVETGVASDPGHSWGVACQTTLRTNQQRPRHTDHEASTTVPRRCITRWVACAVLSWSGGTSGNSVCCNWALCNFAMLQDCKMQCCKI